MAAWSIDARWLLASSESSPPTFSSSTNGQTQPPIGSVEERHARSADSGGGTKLSLDFILDGATTARDVDSEIAETVDKGSRTPDHDHSNDNDRQLRPRTRKRITQSTDRDATSSKPCASAGSRSRPRSRARLTMTSATPDGEVSVSVDAVRGRSLPAAAKTNRTPTRHANPTKCSLTNDEKRLARKCTIDGCLNYTINKGLCFCHGGGKQCTLDGCNASAKISGLCWKHGGSIQCVVDGCDRRGKSRGFCWTHGGGTECRHADCAKVAVSKGYCWAHGGGKRCLYDGCERPAYERTLNYCPKHFKRFESGEETLEV